ncbi:MAG: hypothetical protein Q9222_003065 [Ikaeria aurantiellina]
MPHDLPHSNLSTNSVPGTFWHNLEAEAKRLANIRQPLHSETKRGRNLPIISFLGKNPTPNVSSEEGLDMYRVGVDGDLGDVQETESIMNNFETQGISPEELDLWSQVAPEDQRLSSTAASPKKTKTPRPKKKDKRPDGATKKKLNHFSRRHRFVAEQSFGKYTTSNRRAFERDVYDYARALGLSKAQGKVSVISARRLCSEEEYNTDDSRLDDDEINDSATLLVALPASTTRQSPSALALPSIEQDDKCQSCATHIEKHRKRGHDASKDRAEKRRKTDDNPVSVLDVDAAEAQVEGPSALDAVNGAKAVAPAKKHKVKASSKQPVQVDHNVEAAGLGHMPPPQERLTVQQPGKTEKEGGQGENTKIDEHRPSNGKHPSDKHHKKEKRKHRDKSSHAASGNAQGPEAGPNDPKTQEEAHHNFLMANERDPHEHDMTADKTPHEREEATRKAQGFVEELKATREYSNNQMLKAYKDGSLKYVNKAMKEDFEDMIAQQDTVSALDAEAATRENEKMNRKHIKELKLLATKRQLTSNEILHVHKGCTTNEFGEVVHSDLERVGEGIEQLRAQLDSVKPQNLVATAANDEAPTNERNEGSDKLKHTYSNAERRERRKARDSMPQEGQGLSATDAGFQAIAREESQSTAPSTAKDLNLQSIEGALSPGETGPLAEETCPGSDARTFEELTGSLLAAYPSPAKLTKHSACQGKRLPQNHYACQGRTSWKTEYEPHIGTQRPSTDSSPLSSAPSSPRWPSPSLRPQKQKIEAEQEAEIQLKKRKKRKADSKGDASTSSPTKKRNPSAKSPYFITPSKTSRPQVSCIPFPPLRSTSFGLVQESLASNPFHLLIAVIFLNKTRGAVAMPVFYTFISRFPNPASLAAAEHEEVVSFFQNLGLQNQRAKKCIALAKAWLAHPPKKGKRWRRLHYPLSGDGKDIKGEDEPVADETEDARVAWEVGHLPGIGAYGIDSWRIFCRDELRGVGTAALPKLEPGISTESMFQHGKGEMKLEWTRVLPTDKELRAYLRWRWLRLGFEWDPKTGERKLAEGRVYDKALYGGVICEGDQGWSLGKLQEETVRQIGNLFV